MRQLLLLALFVACSSATLQPQVAFRCGKPSIYLSLSGPTKAGWVRDDAQGCVDQLSDVLAFCRRVYPDLAANFSGVVPSADVVQIHNWCNFKQKRCEGRSHNIHLVRPFKCLTTQFVPEALLVPDKCSFGHVFSSVAEQQCRSLEGWRKEAAAKCREKSKQPKLYSMGVLTPCEIDKNAVDTRQRYAGVEYVCCPSNVDGIPLAQAYIVDSSKGGEPLKHHVVAVKTEATPSKSPKPLPKASKAPKVKPTTEEHPMEDEEFLAKEVALRKEEAAKEKKLVEEFTEAMRRLNSMKTNEEGAQQRLQAELIKRFKLKFQQTISDEVAKWRNLDVLHQSSIRRQIEAKLDVLRHRFVTLLAADGAQEATVWTPLKDAVRLVMRAKLQALSHFSNLMVSDPDEAVRQRQMLREHFQRLNLTLEELLGELKRLPSLENVLRQRAHKLAAKYGNLDASKNILLSASQNTHQGEQASKSVLERDGNKRMERIIKPYEHVGLVHMTRRKQVVFADDPNLVQQQRRKPASSARPVLYDPNAVDETDDDSVGEDTDGDEDNDDDEEEQEEGERTSSADPEMYHSIERLHGVKQMALQHTNAQAEPLHNIGSPSEEALESYQVGSLIGGLVAGMALLLLVLIVVIAVRHRHDRPHSGYVMSVVELDPADEQAMCPPTTGANGRCEDRHLANMQINGYENPTYKYFEKQ